jgi:quercetin dioxygenase-like cupin family protein
MNHLLQCGEYPVNWTGEDRQAAIKGTAMDDLTQVTLTVLGTACRFAIKVKKKLTRLAQEIGMLSKLFWTGAVVCLATVSAPAQDPVKVEPSHYSLNFENDRVQVVSVNYGPHEKSALHDHPGGVVVVLSEAHLRFTDESGKTREVFAKPGEVRWYPPFKHRVENLGDTTYHAVYIGMKGKQAAAETGSPESDPAHEAEIKKIVAEYLLASAKP